MKKNTFLENIFSVKNDNASARKVWTILGIKLKFKRNETKLQEKWFKQCVKEYNSKNTTNRFEIKEDNYYKCFGDNLKTTPVEPQYTYHLAWAARCLQKINPQKHVDISSHTYFSTLLSAFIPIDFYDYRPAPIYNLSGLECKAADLTNLFFEDNSIESLSCMHTIEHIGLGRYGDEIDPDGDIKAINELKRVLAINGNLLFVVPIGKPKLQFNAHRIYSYDMIMNYFDNFELIDYSLITKNALKIGITNNATKELTDKQSLGCGCFWFRKKS